MGPDLYLIDLNDHHVQDTYLDTRVNTTPLPEWKLLLASG